MSGTNCMHDGPIGSGSDCPGCAEWRDSQSVVAPSDPRPGTSPTPGTAVLCLMCAYVRPWSLWHPRGVAICIVCHMAKHLGETVDIHDALWMDTRGGTMEALRSALKEYRRVRDAKEAT